MQEEDGNAYRVIECGKKMEMKEEEESEAGRRCKTYLINR
jgi:hypothetical protein